MHIRGFLAGLAATAALLVGTGQADAVVTYHLSGTVDTISPGITAIATGDPFTLNIAVEPATPDLDPTAQTGSFAFAVPAFGFIVGGYAGGGLGLLSGQVTVRYDFFTYDGIEILLFPTFSDTPDGLPFGAIGAYLLQSNADVLSSDSLLDALLADAAAFAEVRFVEFYLGTASEGGFPEYIRAAINEAGIVQEPHPVPAPASLALFAAGLAGLGAKRRRGERRPPQVSQQ